MLDYGYLASPGGMWAFCVIKTLFEITWKGRKSCMEKMKQWTRQDVIAEVANSFPKEDPQTILALLDEFQISGAERVHMAILKISEGDIDQLRTYIRAACLDYRDVLMWAEM
jgi:hypothetical protein